MPAKVHLLAFTLLAAGLTALPVSLPDGLLSGAGTGAWAAPEKPSDEDAEAAAEEDPWADFEDAEQGFALAFPEEPKVSSKPVEGQNPLVQHDYQSDPHDGRSYHAVVLEYPEDRAPDASVDYYKGLISTFAGATGGKVISDGPAMIAGVKGYEATIAERSGQRNYLLDILPHGDRFYMLTSVGPRGHTKSDEALRFRDSFRLIEIEKRPAADDEAKPDTEEENAAAPEDGDDTTGTTAAGDEQEDETAGD